MANDLSFLKNASTESVVRTVTSYGPIALCHNGLNEMQNAEVATKAIMELDSIQGTLTSFFVSPMHPGQYEKVEYEILDVNPNLSFVILVKKIYSKVLFENQEQKIQVKKGPFLPRDKAQAFVDLANTLFNK